MVTLEPQKSSWGQWLSRSPGTSVHLGAGPSGELVTSCLHLHLPRVPPPAASLHPPISDIRSLVCRVFPPVLEEDACWTVSVLSLTLSHSWSLLTPEIKHFLLSLCSQFTWASGSVATSKHFAKVSPLSIHHTSSN